MTELTIKPKQQINDFTCGHACLAMVTGEPIQGLIERFGHEKGTSFDDLASVLVEYGIFPEFINSSGYHPFPHVGVYIVGTASLNFPGKTHWVLVAANEERFIVHDPNAGREGKEVYDHDALDKGEPGLPYPEIIYLNTKTLSGMRNKRLCHVAQPQAKQA